MAKNCYNAVSGDKYSYKGSGGNQEEIEFW
jgi:hypothetical protein